MRPALYIGGGLLVGGITFIGYSYAFGDVHTLKDIKPDDPTVAMPPQAMTALVPKVTQTATRRAAIRLFMVISCMEAQDSPGDSSSPRVNTLGTRLVVW